jgi:hypothetical protein
MSPRSVTRGILEVNECSQALARLPRASRRPVSEVRKHLIRLVTIASRKNQGQLFYELGNDSSHYGVILQGKETHDKFRIKSKLKIWKSGVFKKHLTLELAGSTAGVLNSRKPVDNSTR